MRLCKFTVTIISSLPCLHTFWHAIPTSREISIRRNQFDGSEHFVDISRAGNMIETKTNQHINERGMDSCSNKLGIHKISLGDLADA